MRVKNSLNDLIGKIISGVVVAQYPKGNPRSRIFFTFSDGTAFEFWEDEQAISMAGGLDYGGVDQIAELLERREGSKIVAFRASHEDPDEPQQDWLCSGVRVNE
jgi:hypothetical protein